MISSLKWLCLASLAVGSSLAFYVSNSCEGQRCLIGDIKANQADCHSFCTCVDGSYQVEYCDFQRYYDPVHKICVSYNTCPNPPTTEVTDTNSCEGQTCQEGDIKANQADCHSFCTCVDGYYQVEYCYFQRYYDSVHQICVSYNTCPNPTTLPTTTVTPQTPTPPTPQTPTPPTPQTPTPPTPQTPTPPTPQTPTPPTPQTPTPPTPQTPTPPTHQTPTPPTPQTPTPPTPQTPTPPTPQTPTPTPPTPQTPTPPTPETPTPPTPQTPTPPTPQTPTPPTQTPSPPTPQTPTPPTPQTPTPPTPQTPTPPTPQTPTPPTPQTPTPPTPQTPTPPTPQTPTPTPPTPQATTTTTKAGTLPPAGSLCNKDGEVKGTNCDKYYMKCENSYWLKEPCAIYQKFCIEDNSCCTWSTCWLPWYDN